MTPAEVVLTLLRSLSDADRRKVAAALGNGATVDTRPVCERVGHRFKKMVTREPMWLGMVEGTVTLVCECCGEAITRKTGRWTMLYCTQSTSFPNRSSELLMRKSTTWCLIGFSLVPCAKASPILDQANQGMMYGSAVMTHDLFHRFRLAQTFQVGLAGDLLRVELAVQPNPYNYARTIYCSIAQTHNGIPVLAPELMLATSSVVIPNRGFEQFRPLPFSDPYYWAPIELPPVRVSAGDRLALIVWGNNEFAWAFGKAGSYPSGGPFNIRNENNEVWPLVVSEVDFLFRTFVSPVPEPHAWLLAASAAIAGRTMQHGRRRVL